jgi:hypothetical protein
MRYLLASKLARRHKGVCSRSLRLVDIWEELSYRVPSANVVKHE